jgi:hypothetical protein
MRSIILAVIAMLPSVAMSNVALAGEVEEAHRDAVVGRDSYWNCLAQEYNRDSNKGLSGQDFTSLIASVCPSERQNFRVTLLDYLSMQFPDSQADANLTTANRAIELAQKDILTAFVHRKGDPN